MSHREPVVVISSSPDFPSICELIPKPTKKPPLRSGSNAAPDPEGAPSAFTTASALWRPKANDNATSDTLLDQTDLLSSELTADSLDNRPGRTQGQKLAAGTIAGKRKTQKCRLEDDTGGTLTANTTADAPAKKVSRKPRPTKDGAMAQTTKPQGEVTKLATNDTETKKKKAETVSRHFPHKASASRGPRQPAANPTNDEPVNLEPAIMRRMDWTPPRETVPAPRLAVSPTTQELASSTGQADGVVFKHLHDTYSRNAGADLGVNHASHLAAADILGKRKLIEMVASAGKQRSLEPSPTKPKAVKKKPRTITELATAAYRLPVVEDVSADDPKPDPLLGYLETANGEAEPAGRPARTKGKVMRRPAKPEMKQTGKRDQAPKHLLLSPASAIRQVAKQDFVFGTASQLATEDDPDLLRALDEAMKASNRPDGDSFASPNPRKSNLTIRKRQGPRLWAAGARYDDSDFVDAAVLDLTRSSPIARALAHTQYAQNAACGDQDPQTPTNDAYFEPPPSNQEQHQLLLSQSGSPHQEQPQLPPQSNFELYTDARLAKEVASYGFKAVKKREVMVALLSRCCESKNNNTLGGNTASANISTTTAAETAASPSRRTGRPSKDPVPSTSGAATQPPPTIPGRNKCVSASIPGSAPLCEKRPCGRPRKDATRAAASPSHGRKQSHSASVSDSGGEGAPHVQKRPRGRPKKDPVASPPARSTAKARSSPRVSRTAAKLLASAPATPRRRKTPGKSTIEIPDSDTDDPFAPTPASSASIQDDVFSSPPAMDLSVTEDTELSLMASPTSQQVSLFRYITDAVVSALPTKDPENPSWHEKMLMYDPIVLEDLTAWLNSGQLDRVGYDGEVAPVDVKKWCESKSVWSFLFPSTVYPRGTSPQTHGRTTLELNASHCKPFPSAKLTSHVKQMVPVFRITSTSFASAHVFPGGNVSSFHDGPLPPPDTRAFHEDGPAYRLAAIRETFEESGILLARKSGGDRDEGRFHIPDDVREAGRKLIHQNQIRFTEWLQSQGGEPDVENLIPFTRWITPYGPPRRFTTQMYLYMLPLSSSAAGPSNPHPLPSGNQQLASTTNVIPTPTPDGGLEHTAATLDNARTWLARAGAGDIILFPPQSYLLYLVSGFLAPLALGMQQETDALSLRHFYQAQRDALLRFLRSIPTSQLQVMDKARTGAIPWSEKVMSPAVLFKRKGDGRLVLGLDKPGPELKGSGRGGDWERVVLVGFRSEGPRDVEVREREEVLREEREGGALEEAKL
ncbi:hypothetical protein N658DRAFT_434995 [Parathielavia hyrcaniae]|uniref:Structure-specific endonuclease subunit SLX4 n=1 Tax=Parathielavia hyrcaniae TaxID=113614 RepID=A0AAN6SY07_9PEZI|nr:hypothetical protein N658DRAFT_434995 [Parathielavia hyrcaniae]